MSDETEWAIPAAAQPRPEDCAFDLERALAAVVAVRTEIPADAFTASILGTERAGNGVVIDQNGLILTIGYLITEAETVWVSAHSGAAAPAHVVGYDQATGFGLIQALGRLGAPPLELGSAQASAVGDEVIVAGEGGLPACAQGGGGVQARVRRLLGIRAGRGDLHQPAAPELGWCRLHRRRRPRARASARCSCRRRAARASRRRAT